MIFTAIVASARARSGKTLVARLLADNFILAGGRPAVFDTDTGERSLWSAFRNEAFAVDLDRVTDQMALFDKLTLDGAESRIIEISQHSFRKFFDLMRDSDYVAEARSRNIEPVIFYIPSPDPDSFDQGRQLHEQFPDCPFVVVENEYLGEARPFTKLGVGYRALEALHPKLKITAFDPSLTRTIDDPSLSYSEFIRETRPEMTQARADAARDWLLQSFKQVYWVIQHLEHPDRMRPPPRRESNR